MGSHTVSATAREGRREATRQALDALRRIVRELRRPSSAPPRRAGVTAARLFVLQLLAEQPGASINDLAERTNTDQSSVSVVVRRLEAAKLVARKASAADARRVELRLTAAGARLVARYPEPTQNGLFAALDRIESTELRALQRGLSAIVREMHLEEGPPPMFFEDETAALRARRPMETR